MSRIEGLLQNPHVVIFVPNVEELGLQVGGFK
jgi:hypothetical protein